MLNNYICALDIGSSKIAAAVAQIKRGCVNSIFFESVPSKGVKAGAIVDSISLVGSVSRLMNNLKAKSGIKIKSLYVSISGQAIVTRHSHAIVPLAERGDKIITVSDIERANEQARILGSSLEEELIHLIPSGYTIDSRSNVINPLGLYSHKLEVDLYLIGARLSQVQSLNRVIDQSGYEIKSLFFSGLATSRAVFGKEINEGINLFCDIGSDITELLIFKNAILKDIEILDIGGDSFTGRLSDTLKIPLALAEEIKKSYGIIGDLEKIGEDKEILIKRDNLYKPIKQREVLGIITSQAKLICSKLKDAVEKKVKSYEVNNFVAVGRTILLEGFIETLESTLAIPVRLGGIANPDIPSAVKEDNALSGQKYLTYLTPLGMICQALQYKATGVLPTSKPTKNLILKAVNKFKEVYQEYF